MGSITFRVRSLVWFVTGAVLATAVTLMFAEAWRVDADPGDEDSTFVPIAPCRLADTRPAPNRIGSSGTLSTDDTTTFQATGANGECTLPSDAVGLSLNVTALGATTPGNFLTVWPDGERPLAASLNPAPGEPPTPNAVTTPLSNDGSFNVYNFVGSVDIVVDVVGFYTSASLQELAQRLAAVEASSASNAGAIASTNASVAALDVAQAFTVVADNSPSTVARSTPTQIASVSVTAPAEGTVTAAASAYIAESTPGQLVGCGIDLMVPPTAIADDVVWQRPDGGDSVPVSVTRAFDVAAGAETTFYFLCRNLSGGDTGINEASLAATFTPAP